MELKQEYNHWLERYYKGSSYLENEDIDIADRLKWEDEFKNILSNLNRLIKEIGNTTKQERLEGFIVK